jgi:hypothetical protein
MCLFVPFVPFVGNPNPFPVGQASFPAYLGPRPQTPDLKSQIPDPNPTFATGSGFRLFLAVEPPSFLRI